MVGIRGEDLMNSSLVASFEFSTLFSTVLMGVYLQL